MQAFNYSQDIPSFRHIKKQYTTLGPRFDHHLFFDPFQILIIFYDAPDLPVAMGFLKTLPHLLECSKTQTTF